MDREAASRHRQRLNDLRQERDAIEEDLLQAPEILRASLVAHTILAGGDRRRQPAFNLARRDSGRRRMVYIRKAESERARRQVESDRRYVEGLHRLRALGREIRPPLYYAASLPTKADPYAIRRYHLQRWIAALALSARPYLNFRLICQHRGVLALLAQEEVEFPC